MKNGYISKPVMVYSQRWMTQRCGNSWLLYDMKNDGCFADDFTSFEKMIAFIENKEKENNDDLQID